MSLLPFSSEHIMEPIHITTQRTDAYLIDELIVVDFFCHDNAINKAIVNAFYPGERFLAINDFPGDGLIAYAIDQITDPKTPQATPTFHL